MDPALTLAIALTVADYGQTRTIAANPQTWTEMNHIMGKHPSVGAVNTYFLGYTAVNIALDYALPQPWKKYHRYYWIGTEAYCVGSNIHAGIKFTF
jgi:hypothetical protein